MNIYLMGQINQKSFNLSIGRSIRDYREMSNMTRNDLALKSNVNEKYLGKIERGECSASAFIIKKIATGLDINISKLLKGL